MLIHNASVTVVESSLVPRPSYRLVFDHLQYSKTEGEGLGTFYHVKDISVYLGKPRGGAVLDQKSTFHACVVRFEPGTVHFLLLKCSQLQCLKQKLQEKASSLLFQLGTPPPSVDTDIIHMIKWTRPSPSFYYAYCK